MAKLTISYAGGVTASTDDSIATTYLLVPKWTFETLVLRAHFDS